MKKLLLLFFLILAISLFKVYPVQAQTCTTNPPTNTGTVVLSATSTAGTYRVWARMKAANSTNNSFYLKLDSGCAILVGDNSGISSSGWTWVDYQNGTTSNKINVTLTAGTHVVTLIGNESGVSVDKILMTKNLSCVPTGTSGDNCPAEVTLTPSPTSAPGTHEISGRMFIDTNTNGIWDTGESGYIATSQRISTTGSATNTSNIDGTYHLTGLANGTYSVTAVIPAGYTATNTNPRSITVNGANSTGNNFGIRALPTPTPAPNSTVLRFNSVELHGIGSGGDNSNPNSEGTTNPLRTSRTLTVDLVNSSGATFAINGNIAYKNTTGDFGGDISATIPSGLYLVKIKSPGYLRRQLTGIVNITSSSINTLPASVLVTGDMNNDNALTISDYNILLDCYSDLLPAKNCSDSNKKTSADLTDDGNVNASDYNLFLRELSVVNGN